MRFACRRIGGFAPARVGGGARGLGAARGRGQRRRLGLQRDGQELLERRAGGPPELPGDAERALDAPLRRGVHVPPPCAARTRRSASALCCAHAARSSALARILSTTSSNVSSTSTPCASSWSRLSGAWKTRTVQSRYGRHGSRSLERE